MTRHRMAYALPPPTPCLTTIPTGICKCPLCTPHHLLYHRQPHDTSVSLLQFSTPTLLKYHLALSNTGRKKKKFSCCNHLFAMTLLPHLYSKKKSALKKRYGGKTGGEGRTKNMNSLNIKKLSHNFCRTMLCHLAIACRPGGKPCILRIASTSPQ